MRLKITADARAGKELQDKRLAAASADSVQDGRRVSGAWFLDPPLERDGKVATGAGGQLFLIIFAIP
jgi:hypothetical protein